MTPRAGSKAPDLRVLGGDQSPGARPLDAAAETASRTGRPWLLWLLLAAVTVLLIGYAVERGRVGALEEEVASLQSELGEARAAVRAAEERMDRVRGHVADLADGIDRLQQAVDAPLTAPPGVAGAETREEAVEAALERNASEAPAPLQSREPLE